MANERVFNSAREVWENFVSRSEIQPRSYDSDLPDALRRALAIPQSDGDLSDDLEQHAISLERFIIALLEVGEPLSMMMSDLCELLERQGLRRGPDAMHLRFDFASADGSRLQFDLEHFRNWIRTFERVREVAHVHKWTYDALWALHFIVSDAANALRAPQVSEPAAFDWIACRRLRPQERPADPGPMPTPSVDDLPADVRACVRLVADLVNDVTVAESRLANDEDVSGELPDGPQPSYRFPAAFVRFLETDFFTASVAEATWRWSEALRRLLPEQREIAGAPTVVKIRGLVGELDVISVDRETLRERLEEVLSLPVWKLRSTLYSVWLISLAERAFPDAEMELHAANGVLNLSLRTHVATFSRGEQRFAIMSEHRVPLEDPKGDSRVSGAQPDYTFQPAAASAAAEAYAVLEAKQYRRASTANFRAAARPFPRRRTRVPARDSASRTCAISQ